MVRKFTAAIAPGFFKIFLLPFITLPVAAKSLPEFIDYLDSSLGFGYGNGTTSYQIGNNITDYRGTITARMPISELKFPLNTNFFTVDMETAWFRYVKFSVSFVRNLRSSTTKSSDADFGVAYYRGVPGASIDSQDIYSESDVQFDLTKIKPKIGIELPFFREWFVYSGLGYSYQDNFFRMANLIQTCAATVTSYCGGASAATYLGPDSEYGIQYQIWSLDLGFRWKPHPRLELGGIFAYSPYTKAADRDEHLLRELLLVGQDSGSGFAISGWVRVDLGETLFLKLTEEYAAYKLSGTQTQSYYFTKNTQTHPTQIDQKISLTQFQLSGLIGYRLR